ncbi:translational GTPase TypA [Thermaurantiacus sp.]
MPLRNVAIIAHVDHGKTTLVDQMLKASGTFRVNQRVVERAMDSNDLERERGITILAKCTSVCWHGTRINIVDTPGHADFGGEVERILSMVDGVLLLVDAAEGPMPQTKFVLSKALALGLRPIVVLNKIDRADARAHAVLDAVFDLFVTLGASDAQLDFPVLYASGRAGYAGTDPAIRSGTLEPLFECILAHVPAPAADPDKPFRLLVSLLDRDAFVGRMLTGRIASGRLKLNMPIRALDPSGHLIEEGRATKIFAFRGLERVPVDAAEAGDIVSIAGMQAATVAHTLADPAAAAPLAAQPIDPPTLVIRFSVNDSPFAGREGSKVTSRMIRDRLFLEAEGNVAIRVTESDSKDSFEVAGRGELQLGILIETMRREGFELTIGRPQVIQLTDDLGHRLEPHETIIVDVDEAWQGIVVEKMALRKADLVDMAPSGGGKLRLSFFGPTRGLIGYHSEFLSDTRGTGVMNRQFARYAPWRGPISGRPNGVLVSTETGAAVGYALGSLEERGVLMIAPGEPVYQGMIIGENARSEDLEVNPLRSKQLTNFRAAGKDDALRLTPPRRLTLEQAIAFIAEDECVEVTPKSIRVRKRILDPHERKRQARAARAG